MLLRVGKTEETKKKGKKPAPSLLVPEIVVEGVQVVSLKQKNWQQERGKIWGKKLKKKMEEVMVEGEVAVCLKK
jgi:ribosomal protein L24